MEKLEHIDQYTQSGAYLILHKDAICVPIHGGKKHDWQLRDILDIYEDAGNRVVADAEYFPSERSLIKWCLEHNLSIMAMDHSVEVFILMGAAVLLHNPQNDKLIQDVHNFLDLLKARSISRHNFLPDDLV